MKRILTACLGLRRRPGVRGDGRGARHHADRGRPHAARTAPRRAQAQGDTLGGDSTRSGIRRGQHRASRMRRATGATGTRLGERQHLLRASRAAAAAAGADRQLSTGVAPDTSCRASQNPRQPEGERGADPFRQRRGRLVVLLSGRRSEQ